MKSHSTAPGMMLTVFSAFCLTGAAASLADEHWTVDFEKAKATAAKEKKSILMEFTGSDWCPPCKALHSNVLSKELFLTEVPRLFVLLKLDNPLDKSQQSEEEIAQYKELSARYKVTGLPTVILADPDGKLYAKLVGYGGQNVEDYVAQLAKKAQILQHRDEFLAKAEKAEGAEKAKLLNEAISLMDADVALTTYKDIVEQIIKLDSDNEAGLKSKYEAVFQASQIKEELDKIRRSARGDAKQGIVQLDDLISRLQPTGEHLQQVLYYKAMFVYDSDKEASQELLLAARKIAPESKLAENIDRVLKQVFKVDPETLAEAQEGDKDGDKQDADKKQDDKTSDDDR